MVGETGTKGGRRREQILAAAVELFGEVGYRGTSLRDIAQRVGITHPGLLYHFHSKQELLSAVLERRDDTNDDVFHLLEQPSAREHVKRVLELAAHNATIPGMIELFATLSAESTDPDHPAHDYFTERYRKIVGINQRIFDDLYADGELREGVDPKLLGPSFTALMDGLQIQWLYDPESVDMPEALRFYFNTYLKNPL
ncbi:TetR/AcrR family transcriptional regulator [Enemella evansiae]|uniref:TetR family transcriptional regulator n=1 Tax=Enemella evansiae TaxID=2016499 RepID=A0A255GS20_9ACTN|nr:TetR/AcrR family transcriptional regulator [Enemella evansiae]PFG69266.1 TetR family transcriptional regulator [Propionibacteriaceae bacterium ES.041]OYO00887.1 TetR family transcriptional regulator [Enemella evansiae]OYO02491.1 TetR family transcriptional regulator [Enemella evansiae]OYO02987.1 TetR family transcriptional regulator [Enemella evansiae]OYO12157.1 TetR family transcriptional regulator [Enemella evansiae]